MSKDRVLVVGSSNFDLTIYCEHIPRIGETVIGGSFASSIGGKGANQATACARMGMRTDFLGAVGDDMHGELIQDHFRKEGIGTHWIKIPADTTTGVALILVDQKGQNSIAVAPGANAMLSEGDLSMVPFSNYSHVLVSLEVPLAFATQVARLARESDCFVVLNPAPAARLPRVLLEHSDILIPNEHEVTELLDTGTDEDPHIAVARAFFSAGGRALLVTLGEDGVRLIEQDRDQMIAGIRVKAIDTVGAGDCFCGAFVASLASGVPMDQAIEFANLAASVAVQRKGAIPSFPRREELFPSHLLPSAPGQ